MPSPAAGRSLVSRPATEYAGGPEPASIVHPRTVSIRGDVAAELTYAAEYRPESYQACILIGSPTAGGTEIAGFTDLATFDGPLALLTELADDWVPMRRRVARFRDGLDVVGWASLRPKSEGRISDAEALVHRTFFNLPHHVTVVVDPETGAMTASTVNQNRKLVPATIPQTARTTDEAPA